MEKVMSKAEKAAAPAEKTTQVRVPESAVKLAQEFVDEAEGIDLGKAIAKLVAAGYTRAKALKKYYGKKAPKTPKAPKVAKTAKAKAAVKEIKEKRAKKGKAKSKRAPLEVAAGPVVGAEVAADDDGFDPEDESLESLLENVSE